MTLRFHAGFFMTSLRAMGFKLAVPISFPNNSRQIVLGYTAYCWYHVTEYELQCNPGTSLTWPIGRGGLTLFPKGLVQKWTQTNSVEIWARLTDSIFHAVNRPSFVNLIGIERITGKVIWSIFTSFFFFFLTTMTHSFFGEKFKDPIRTHQLRF